jgi:hypothetical protein
MSNLRIEKTVKIHFQIQKESKVELDIISICSGIISGLKTDKHVCIHKFYWGSKKNTLNLEEISASVISFFAKLKFTFADKEEESRIMKELLFYINALTPRELKYSIIE